jgi:hypothetical protein
VSWAGARLSSAREWLSAAGVLARHFEEVVILERDNLPASAVSRSGTPQDRHPHGLLAGGLRALDEIFPG